MKDRIRFRPPEVALTPELRWVLAWAFADEPALSAPAAIDPAVAIDLARRLGLDARIGERLARAGAPREAALERARASAMASVLRARAAAETVAAVAAERGIACCFLKGVALDALGATAPGSRPMSDIDVLVAPADAHSLAEALCARGFDSGGEEYAHQLRPLVHPNLGIVELHRHLPGVRPSGGSAFATLADARRDGLIMKWEGMLGGACLPAVPLLLAHLLAHALGQHAFRPDAYPPLRVLGDFIDLGLGREHADGLLERSLPLVRASVPEAECRAAEATCGILIAGGTADLREEQGARALLRHQLAGALDARYRARLALRELRHPLVEVGRAQATLRALGAVVLLSSTQIDAIYGPPRHPWGYAARRAARPFDLAWRAARAVLGFPAIQRSTSG